MISLVLTDSWWNGNSADSDQTAPKEQSDLGRTVCSRISVPIFMVITVHPLSFIMILMYCLTMTQRHELLSSNKQICPEYSTAMSTHRNKPI